jgi:predicted RNase H-like nuclease (RuvC/YqgF family)
MKTIECLVEEIEDCTHKLKKYAKDNKYCDYRVTEVNQEIKDLKDDLAMLKTVERDGFVKGVNAVLDDSMIEVLESKMNLAIIAIVKIKEYDKGVYDND